MSNKDKSSPQTAGELRRLIADKGYKWTVDSRLRDSDQLPKYPRGGKLASNVKPNSNVVEDVSDFLRQKPPSNPFLRDHWVELKLLTPKNLGSSVGSPPDISTRSKEKKR